MEIKFTHTGAIPFKEFPEDQKFIVIRNRELRPMFIRKDASVFRVVGDYLAISRQEEFMAWEPVSLTLPSSALVTRRLWLTRPNLSDSRGWGFRLYEKIQSEIRVWIKDPQFNHDFFTERNLSVGFGDVFEAVMARVPMIERQMRPVYSRSTNSAASVMKAKNLGSCSMNYKQFLKTKIFSIPPVGKRVDPSLVNPQLFQFQRDIVLWALQKGRAAIFAGTGLGKTLMQCEWARLVGGRVIIFAPLAVSKQTVTEAAKFGITVHYCAEAADVCDGINITNYERLEKFDIRDFNAVVLDESSILKNMSGKLRTKLIDSCARVPYRLACTATPAPNDLMELCNHSEFLGIMTATEMLATFFTHDGGDTSKWRLKKHAVIKFWDWVASWAVMLTNPADIGYVEDGKRYILPPLRMHEHVVHSDDCSGFLFPMAAETLQERQQARRDSIKERSEKCAEVVMNDKENSQWLIWCNLNDEAEAIRKLIPGAVEIRGSDSSERKESAALGFASGEIKVLISKPLIFGMGLNFQRCHNMAFLGLSDSFEQYYQAVRRCWRFGQTQSVNVHIITDEREGAVVENIRRKEAQFQEMLAGMIASCQETNKANIKSAKRDLDDYKPKTTMTTPSWLTPAA